MVSNFRGSSGGAVVLGGASDSRVEKTRAT
jgi:hypothetical protein